MSEFIRRLPTRGISRYVISVSRIDGLTILLVFVLQIIGLISLYSAVYSSYPQLLYKQIFFYAVGWTIIIFITRLPIVFVRHISFYAYSAGMILLMLITFYGTYVNNAQRWLDLWLFHLQPSEFFKVILPVVLAAYLSRRGLTINLKYISLFVVMTALPCFLIFIQPDLGTAVIVAISGVIVLFFAGASKKYIIAAILITLISIPVIWNFALHDYQRQRVLTLIQPEEKLGSAWHIVQSKAAIGSGGLYGKGWTSGTQSQLEFLPEKHTDFIAAVIAEEWGFIGIIVLIFLYGFMILRMTLTSLGSKDYFSSLVGISLSSMFAFSVLINLAMISGLLPIVGVPLPLISYGGSSIITISVIIGLTARIRWENS